MISSYLQLDKAKHGERIKALYDDYNRFLIEGNEMTKLVLGAGFNDKTRPAWVDGKIVKEYELWQSMLNRCFSEKYQTRQPTYKGCNVSDNFLNYSFFYDWCISNPPYSIFRKFFEHGFKISDNCVWLIPTWKAFSGAGLLYKVNLVS